MKLATVVGARPQFVKAASVSRALAKREDLTELIVHTGQHFDANMSAVFFDELGIPEPVYSLGIAGGLHGASTGSMLASIEDVLLGEKPDAVLVYGDTNSTLAGALAAAKLHIPVVHVESGLRSFNRMMPEEVNRVLTDHISTLLFCPTTTAVTNLHREGITDGVKLVGDVMFDAVLHQRSTAGSVQQRDYMVCTIHRAENVDSDTRLKEIIEGLSRLDREVRLPLHPRTKKQLKRLGLQLPRNVVVLAPQPYGQMLDLIAGSSIVLTDSGGLQKEAYFLGKRCVTLRDETEWVELVDIGVNVLVSANADRIVAGVKAMMAVQEFPEQRIYGDGRAAEKISEEIARYLGRAL